MLFLDPPNGYSIIDGEVSASEKQAALDELEQDFNFSVEHFYYRLDGKFFHITERIWQFSEMTQVIRRFHFCTGLNVHAKEWNDFFDHGLLVDDYGRPIVACSDSECLDYSDEEEEEEEAPSDDDYAVFSDDSSDFSF